MTYAHYSNSKQVNFFGKVKVKLFKQLAKNFPFNSVRVYSLKKCGFSVGKKVYIGEDLIVASMISEKSCHLTIGDRVAIGPRVTLLLSSDANWSKLMIDLKPIRSYIKLDDDCWLGAGVIIMPGVRIGKKAIVGAGAVVTKDVNDGEIVVGVPAKKINKK